MKKIVLLVIIYIQLASFGLTEATTGDKEILKLLPTTKDLPHSKAVGEPEYVVGDDLFQLINGGAEIYHEYGFKQAVSASYKNINDKSFNLEIYEMNVDSGTVKRGSHCQLPKADQGSRTKGRCQPPKWSGIMDCHWSRIRKGTKMEPCS